MSDIAFSSDVSAAAPASPSPVAESPVASEQASPSPGTVESTPSSPTPGEVTAGSDATGQPAQQSNTEAPAVPEYLQGVPTVEELADKLHVPYAKALHQLRPAHEALLEKSRTLEQALEPWKPLTERFGDAEQALSHAELGKTLFTPVVVDGQVQRDERGLPLVSTAPFIERAEQLQPGIADQLMVDLLGRQVNGEVYARHLFRAYGLDPDRINDYRTIGAPTAPQQPSSVVSEAELATIPPEYHDAFKSLTPEERDDMELMSSTSRNQRLQDRKEALDVRKWRESETQRVAAENQRKEAEFKQQIETQQVEYAGQIRQEGFTTIYNNLASQVTFSSDPKVNSADIASIMSVAAVAIDPDLRSLVSPQLQEAGITFDPQIDELVNVIQQNARDQKTAEAYRRTAQANEYRAAISQAKQLLFTKLGGLALQLATARGARLAETVGEQEAQLAGAQARPVISGQPAQTPQQPGFKPGSVAAIQSVWQRTMGAQQG